MVLAITTRKKKSSSRQSGGLSVFGSGDYDRKKKKFQSSVWRVGSGDYDRRKKKFQSSVWRVVLLWFWRLRPEKKSSSRLSGGLSVFCSGDYDRKKKKFQSSVWRVVLLHQFLVLAITTGKKKFQSSVCCWVSFNLN